MNYYFAPMEGLTDSVYRSLHHKYFSGVTAYYMPFLSPTVHRSLTPREARELPPADSVPFRAVPQLLTKVPEDFLWAAGQCKALGYDEINLNLGCPSGTVTAKGKGSGMLRDPASLENRRGSVFTRWMWAHQSSTFGGLGILMLRLCSSSRLAVRPLKESSRQCDCPPHSSLFNRRCE